MMHISPGKILISTPSLTDPNFDKVVIFIAEYNEKGALGFVINTLFPRTFNELTAYRHSPALPLYAGGPVEKESLFFMHRRPDLITGSTNIIESICLGGDFKQAVQYINDNTLPQSDIKLFIGYCGWDEGELEEEITEGSWLICSTPAQTVFAPHVAMLWEQLYEAEK
jgi:putative transcriptional regulator